VSYDAAILIPVLRRPHRVEPLIADIHAATGDRCRIVFIVTRDDRAELRAVRDATRAHATVTHMLIGANLVGDYARKINLAYSRTVEPFLFCGADDLHFHAGWLDAALAPFADRSVGVVGTQDLANRRVRRGDHATHSMVRRAYIDTYGTIDEPRKVLHEGYIHEFVDDEFIATAKHRGAFVFASGSVVEHLHPSVRKAPTDDLYRDEPRRMKAGRILFARRQQLWT
jgi:hypothetical protein